jgi:hypothetical protein
MNRATGVGLSVGGYLAAATGSAGSTAIIS